MEEPNWGLNLRICAMISRDEYDGAEIVRAVKKKLVPGKNPGSQMLSLDLLETCTSNCEKVFSEVASEKVLEDMVKLIEGHRTEHGCRVRAMQLIRAWGESEDLTYLPVFHQTYMPLTPPERYPVPTTALESEEDATFMHYGFQSIEENKEFLVVTRNSLDILSSILNSETEPKPIKDELTVSMLEKCKQSLPVVQRIIETTSDDEVMLFDALNLVDELQLVISRYTEIAAALESGRQTNQKEEEPARDNISNETTVPIQRESDSKTETPVNITTDSTKSGKPSYQDESGDKMS